MRLSHHLREYLAFNRQEQRGAFVLILILSLLVIALWVTGRQKVTETYDFSQYRKDIIQFENEIRICDSVGEAERKNRFSGSRRFYQSVFNDSGKSVPAYKKDVMLIELNAADTFELQLLRGIGPSFARRIVRYRERLGGFIDKKQLLEVFGIDQEKFMLISPGLTVNPDSVHPVDLNNVTFKDLMKHPYFPYGMAKAIMIYRKEHKVIRGIDELRNIPGINDSVMGKIIPYIRIN